MAELLMTVAGGFISYREGEAAEDRSELQARAAEVNGRILHNNFRDFRLDIQIHPKKFTCLNTGPNDNSLFYEALLFLLWQY